MCIHHFIDRIQFCVLLFPLQQQQHHNHEQQQLLGTSRWSDSACSIMSMCPCCTMVPGPWNETPVPTSRSLGEHFSPPIAMIKSSVGSCKLNPPSTLEPSLTILLSARETSCPGPGQVAGLPEQTPFLSFGANSCAQNMGGGGGDV